jgi:hypothetical protein
VAQVLAAMAVLISIAAAVSLYPWLAGYSIYHGYLPVKGRIAGHDSDLPSRASRCANCHDAARGAIRTARRIAPLTRVALTEPHSRRGGPDTTYAENSFCSLLHEGVDPAFVLVSRTMPRYDMSAFNCHALWTYVSSR